MLTALHLTSLHWIRSALGCNTGLLNINHCSGQSKGFPAQFNISLAKNMNNFSILVVMNIIWSLSDYCLHSGFFLLFKSESKWSSTSCNIFSSVGGCWVFCCSAPFMGLCHRGDVKVLPPRQSRERQRHIPPDQIHPQNYTSRLYVMR